MISFERVRTILGRALDLDPERRDAFLDDECRGEPELREHLRTVLGQAERIPSILATGAGLERAPGAVSVEDSTAALDPQPGPALKIPGYVVREKLGEGGMGVVYEAEQLEPRRIVAIKVIRGGSHVSDLEVRLFRREAIALARLRHPSIAAIYEVGRTETGENYFVMERVHGKQLGDFLRDYPLDSPEQRQNLLVRLDLFFAVVEAISYAHQRGVLHRDIKPTNILVALRPGSEELEAWSLRSSAGRFDVKVLDFGLARITDADMNLTTVMTGHGEIRGTLPYMSPEQARGDADLIDVRSDVYSLGVVLYELLTDQLPIETGGLAIHEAVHRICDSEPRRAGSLCERVRGDLEIIVGRALEKDQARRYQSASGFGEDLRRYLTNRPILARRPSRRYQLTKFVARYRTYVILATIMVTLSLASALVMLFLWQGQRREHQQVDIARELAVGEATHAAEAERERTLQLWEASRVQADALRSGARVGRRFDALEALATAAEIRPTLELRNLAIASMALTDLYPTHAAIRIEVDTGNANLGFDGELTRCAASRADGSIEIRDVASGESVMILPKQDGVLHYCAYEPTGRYVAANYMVGTADLMGSPRERHFLGLWDLEKQSLILEQSSTGSEMDFSPDGRRFAYRESMGGAHIVDLRTGEDRRFGDSSTASGALRFSPDGTRIAVDGRHGIEIRDAWTGRKLRDLFIPEPLFSAAWSPDGRTIAAGCKGFHVHLWDVEAGTELRTLVGHRAEVTRLGFHSSGRVLFSSGWDGVLLAWRVEDGAPLFSTRGELAGIARRGDGLAVRRGMQVDLYRVVTGREFRVLRGHDPAVKRMGTVEFTPDGRWVISAGRDAVLAWDPVRACEVASLPTGSSMAALFSVPGKCLITTSERGVLQWPISSQEVGPVFGTPKTIVSEAVGHAAMTRDGQTLYVLDEKGGLLVLDLATGREVRRIPVPAAAGRVAVSPDGRWVTCGGGFHPRVSVLDARTYETVAELRLGRLVASTFGPHGKWLVTAGEQQVRLWEVGTWREQAAVERGPEAPYHRGSVAFSPSGQMIAMAATSSTVRLARVPSLDELATLEAPEEEIISWISFSPDGRQLAVGCEGHKVHIWELDLIRRGLRKLNLDWTD